MRPDKMKKTRRGREETLWRPLNKPSATRPSLENKHLVINLLSDHRHTTVTHCALFFFLLTEEAAISTFGGPLCVSNMRKKVVFGRHGNTPNPTTVSRLCPVQSI